MNIEFSICQIFLVVPSSCSLFLSLSLFSLSFSFFPLFQFHQTRALDSIFVVHFQTVCLPHNFSVYKNPLVSACISQRREKEKQKERKKEWKMWTEISLQFPVHSLRNFNPFLFLSLTISFSSIFSLTVTSLFSLLTWKLHCYWSYNFENIYSLLWCRIFYFHSFINFLLSTLSLLHPLFSLSLSLSHSLSSQHPTLTSLSS